MKGLSARASAALDLLGITTAEQYTQRRDEVRKLRNTGAKTLRELDTWAGVTGTNGRLPAGRLEAFDRFGAQPTHTELRELVKIYCAFFHVKRPSLFPVENLQ